MKRVWVLTILAMIAFAPAVRAQVSVTLDYAQEGVVIDGFGGFGSMMPWWENGPYYNDQFLDLLLDTLGISILRTEPYPLPDQENMWTRQIPYLRAIKQRASEKGIDFKLLGSIWTPPASMKNNGKTSQGQLKTSEYANYGKYLVDYVRRIRQDLGYDLYALSPQNEPALSMGYNSCSYYPNEFAAMFKVVAREFKEAGEPVHLTYADNIVWGGNGWLGDVVREVARDRIADSMGSILSCHYAHHGNVEGNINYFSPLAGWAKERTLRMGGTGRTMVWNTEFNGMYNSWAQEWELTKEGGAWAFATDLFMCLQYDFTAVIIWALCDPVKSDPKHACYALFYRKSDGELLLGPLFKLAQTVFRTVRPGAWSPSVKVTRLFQRRRMVTYSFRSTVFLGLSAAMLSVVTPAVSGTQGYSVFHIGNSLTDETYGVHDAAASLGHTGVAWGRSMIPGCPIWLHWQDKDSRGRLNRRVAPLTESSPAPLIGWVGPYLESTPIDVLVLQVFWANGDSYINKYNQPNLHQETIQALIGFAGLVYTANPQCRVYLYASHTMDIGKADHTLEDPIINYKALKDTIDHRYPGHPSVFIIPAPLAFNAMLAQGGESANLWSDGHANSNGPFRASGCKTC